MTPAALTNGQKAELAKAINGRIAVLQEAAAMHRSRFAATAGREHDRAAIGATDAITVLREAAKRLGITLAQEAGR